MRKQRHQKFFNDKFQTICNTHSQMLKIEKEYSLKIFNGVKEFKKLNTDRLSNNDLKSILINEGIYKGVFYLNPFDLTHLTNLNLEDIHSDFSKLNKRNNNCKSWCVEENDYKKIFVLGVSDDDYCLVAITYNDVGIDYIIQIIPVKYLALQGNIASHMYNFPLKEYD